MTLLPRLLEPSAVAAGVLACIFVTTPSPLLASQQVKLAVSATVLKQASIKVLTQPTAFVITARDIARGYVDVPRSTQIVVATNADGYLLDFSSQSEFTSHVIVTGLGEDVQLSPAGGVLAQRRAQGPNANLVLGFRFVLDAAAQEGTYTWPMRLAVLPL